MTCYVFYHEFYKKKSSFGGMEMHSHFCFQMGTMGRLSPALEAGVAHLQESLELEQSRRKYCERMISNIQATLVEANEEIAALTEQSRRREGMLQDKEEKIRALRLEHSNMENFLRNSLDDMSSKYRCMVTAGDQEKADWRSAQLTYAEKINGIVRRFSSKCDW